MAKLLYDCPMYGLKAGDEVEVKYEEDNKMTNYEFHVGDDFQSVEKYTGYKGKGVELDDNYFNIATERIKKALEDRDKEE